MAAGALLVAMMLFMESSFVFRLWVDAEGCGAGLTVRGGMRRLPLPRANRSDGLAVRGGMPVRNGRRFVAAATAASVHVGYAVRNGRRAASGCPCGTPTTLKRLSSGRLRAGSGAVLVAERHDAFKDARVGAGPLPRFSGATASSGT